MRNKARVSLRKLLSYVFILVMCLSAAGCRMEKNQGDEGRYLAESLTLPPFALFHSEVVHDNILYFLGLDQAGETGGVYRLDMAEEQPEPTLVPFPAEEVPLTMRMAVGADGMLHIITYARTEDKANTLISEAYWKKISEAGEVVHSFSITECFQGQATPYLSGFEIDRADNAYISVGDTVFVFDKSGAFIFQVTSGRSLHGLCRDREGIIYARWSGGMGMEMAEIDSKSRSLGPIHEISSAWVLDVRAGTEEDLLFAMETGVFGYDISQKKMTAIFDWTSLDMAVGDGSILPLRDGRIAWLNKLRHQTDGGEAMMKAELTVIRKLKAGEQDSEKVSEKTVLTLGAVSYQLGPTVKKAVVDFNKANPDFQIEIIEYDNDAGDGMARLNLDIVSGNCPDILLLPTHFSLPLYAQKGVLSDLYPFLDGDMLYERSDFQENIMKACEIDGRLYGFPVFYEIATIFGKRSLLGDRDSWNLSEMYAFADKFVGESQIFTYPTKSNVLILCLYANTDHLVDWSKEVNTFNREAFIQMLEFSDQFIADDRYIHNDDLLSRIEENQLLLFDGKVTSVDSNQLERAIFGEPVSYVGYPSENGNGSLISPSTFLAISSKCTEKEIAWKFISSMLSDEILSERTYDQNLPVRKTALEKQIEKAMEITYDADGKELVNKSFAFSYGATSFSIDAYACTEEEINVIRDLIAKADKLHNLDLQIHKIIMEEAGGFFNGNKTAAETADVVENRIQVYMSEMK